jgi:hypothetical protein
VIPPILLLVLLIAVTVAAAVASTVRRGARSARLARLAGEWSMKFARDDRFVLAPRVAAGLPAPGAADVFVKDLIYTHEAGGAFRYYFTVEYTVGVLRTKRRRVAAGTIVESSRSSRETGAYSPVTLAPPALELLEQYHWLRGQTGAGALSPA